MEVLKENFFSEIKFKNNVLEQKSVEYLKSIPSASQDKYIIDILENSSIFNHFSFLEISELLENVEIYCFKNLTNTTKVEVYNLLMYCKSQIGQINSSLEYLRKVEQIIVNKYDWCYINTLNAKGLINRQLGKFDDALEAYYNALKVLKENKKHKNHTRKKIAIKNNIALIYSEQNEDEKAIEIYFENIKEQKEAGNLAGVSTAYMNIGHAYFIKEEYKKSVEWILKAQELHEETGDKVYEDRLNINVASSYLHLKDYEKAKIYIEKSKKGKDVFSKRVAEGFELKVLLIELDQKELTETDKKNILEKTNYLLSKIDTLNDMNIVLEYYSFIAKSFEKLGDLKKSIQYLNKKFNYHLKYVEKQKVESYKQVRAIHEIQLQEKELEKKENINKQLTSINQELEQFTYMASHDLKSPLRNIIAFSNLINDPDNTKEQLKEYSDLVINNAKKMNALISSLLGYTSIGFSRVKMKKTSLNETIENAKEILNEVIKEKKPIISYGKLPKIIGNSVLLVQLFQNLLCNAIKYNDKDIIQIEISAYKEKGHQIIEVKDNGIGIPANKTKEIFKAFSRAHSSTLYEGTGIGLATCDKIMQIHSGEISVKSVENEGSCFMLKFKM